MNFVSAPPKIQNTLYNSESNWLYKMMFLHQLNSRSASLDSLLYTIYSIVQDTFTKQ